MQFAFIHQTVTDPNHLHFVFQMGVCHIYVQVFFNLKPPSYGHQVNRIKINVTIKF